MEIDNLVRFFYLLILIDIPKNLRKRNYVDMIAVFLFFKLPYDIGIDNVFARFGLIFFVFFRI